MTQLFADHQPPPTWDPVYPDGVVEAQRKLFDTHWGAVGTGDEQGAERFLLWRRWSSAPALVTIGMNPSTATAKKNDRTITKACTLARGWGFGALWMLNAWPLRATKPTDLYRHLESGGTQELTANDRTIRDTCALADRVWVAWGGWSGCSRETRGRCLLRGAAVLRIVHLAGHPVPHVLGFTQSGDPKHINPRIPASQEGELVPWAGWEAYGMGVRP